MIMKELSIEEKAKAYDEAIERANELNYVSDKDSLQRKTVEHIFPELKESEDERIRKRLIELFKGHWSDEWYGLKVDKVLAWLEKQDSYYTFEIKKGHWYKCVCDYMLNSSDLMFKNDRLYYCRRDWRLIGEIDERNVKDIGINGYKSFFRPATNQEIKDWLEKQREQKCTTEEVLIKAGLKPYKDGDQWCILLGDNIQEGICGFGDTVDEALYKFLKELLEKQGEKKLVDKVEPKFKVKKGGWYVCTNTFVSKGKIIAIKGQIYQSKQEDDTITCENDCLFIDRHDGKASDYFRLWTIQDAKDGDVLVDEDNNIGIYKEIEGIYWHSYIYLGCNNRLYGFSIGGSHVQNNTKPATKKQRDLLFQKMEEAGYEWDAEKKELKKIEQKPAEWTEEDEDYYDAIITKLEVTKDDALLTDNQMKFLKSLKDRVQLKQEWSEEDDTMTTNTIIMLKEGASLHFNKKDITKAVDWIKSLRPHWKPSDKQMNALVNALSLAKNCGEESAFDLRTLYEQLKKLREEQFRLFRIYKQQLQTCKR